MARRTVAERFWSKVDRRASTDCWPWTRSLTTSGYGQFRVRTGESPQKASRVAWALTFGPISNGLLVCHRCDNPPCCNPAHLFLGTAADNLADMVAKGRQKFGGPAPGDASVLVERVRTLTDDQLIEARQCRARGESYRSIGRRFDVHHTTILRLCNGTHWERLLLESSRDAKWPWMN